MDWQSRTAPQSGPQFRKETQAISQKCAAARSWHRPSAGPSEIETTKAGAGQTRLNAFLIQNTSSRFQIINTNFIKRGGANIKAGVESKELSGTNANANATFNVDWISRIRKQWRISDIGEGQRHKEKEDASQEKETNGFCQECFTWGTRPAFQVCSKSWSLF